MLVGLAIRYFMFPSRVCVLQTNVPLPCVCFAAQVVAGGSRDSVREWQRFAGLLCGISLHRLADGALLDSALHTF